MSGSWVYIELDARERSSVGASVDITDWLGSLWRSSRRYILPMRLSSNRYSSRDVMVLRVMHSIVPQMAVHKADIRIQRQQEGGQGPQKHSQQELGGAGEAWIEQQERQRHLDKGEYERDGMHDQEIANAVSCVRGQREAPQIRELGRVIAQTGFCARVRVAEAENPKFVALELAEVDRLCERDGQ
ncbi:hypothetical protein KL918_001704 [Ogataea parapolymorpha]|nr:hypothetical protein KL918_001704 [Ogataea parapolymorpha]KAG7874334.1 hypothetical protein KL916_001674 [Ogataea parapolymorpha]